MPPLFLCIVGLCWIQIPGVLVVAELDGASVVDRMGHYVQQAILYSLAAMLALAFGIRVGALLGTRVYRSASRVDLGANFASEPEFNLNNALISYVVAAAVVVNVLAVVAGLIPGLAQI